MQAKQVIVSRLFHDTMKAEESIIVHRGGARSGKSFSIAQYLVWRMTNEKNCKILVTRKTMPALKLTAYKLMVELLKEYGYYDYCEHSLTNNYIIYRPTNTFMAFISIDNPERIKSSEWNVIHMEEMNEFTYNDFMILKTRLSAPTKMRNHLIGSFNPTSAFHWVKTEMIDVEDSLKEIVSNYKDNSFLQQSYIDILLSTKDKNYRRIYVDGEWGTLENVVFSDWSQIKKIPDKFTMSDRVWGIDWGFTHPSTLVSCIKDGDDLYVQEHFYESNNTNADLMKKFSKIIPNINSVNMYGDSAEPARLQEFRNNNISIRPSVKGPNSVKDSIDYINRHNIYITEDSINLIKEMRTYSWQVGKNDNMKETPINIMDDAIAAMRYATYSHYANRPEYTVVVPAEHSQDNKRSEHG